LATNQDKSVPFNPDEQLARLRSWCRDSAPAFYGDQADYLRLLRHHLPQAVHTALGQLLCGVDRDRLNLLSDQARAELQERIDQLVNRCSTLLTIEQLQLLARDLSREQKTQRRQLQKAMVESLQRSSDELEPASSPTESDPVDSRAAAGPGTGSVSLSLSPPIDQPDLLEGLLPPRQHAENQADQAMAAEFGNDVDAGHIAAHDDNSDDDASDAGSSFGLDVQFEEPPTGMEPSELGGDPAQGGSDLDLLRSLFVMAGQAMDADEEASRPTAADAEPSAGDTDDASEFMPSMPLELQRWLDGLDQAVKRRLRNLSHAINVELLRAGLASSLLPISLLDAVLSGQVETLPSASNVLRLRVPLPITPHAGDDLIDLSCILLRTADIEFDLVPLRRCRSRLRQRKRSLLTMVRQQRHWQRRAQTQQVQQQWWQSPPTSSPQT
jgi:hypothetical protein